MIAQMTSGEADDGVGDDATSVDIVVGASCPWVDLPAERVAAGEPAEACR